MTNSPSNEAPVSNGSSSTMLERTVVTVVWVLCGTVLIVEFADVPQVLTIVSAVWGMIAGFWFASVGASK